MNICYISNFSKTYLHEAIAKRLIQQDFNVFWIATNIDLYNHLSNEFGKKKVLLININHVSQSQKLIGEYKVNEIVYGDRILRNQPENGIQFLTNIQKPIYDFIKSNNIKKVFGEITWGHEVLIHRMCQQEKQLNCQFLNPHVVRIPDARFAFFTDERQSKLLEIKNNNSFPWKTLRPKAPKYLSINQKIQKKTNSFNGKLSKIKKFIMNRDFDRDDPSLQTNTKFRLLQKIQEEYRKKQYKKIEKTSFESVKHLPYVFLGLHKQPEASVDVFGRYYEDQLQNIKNLWRALPSGWSLIVKEHSIAIGDRSSSFYKNIQALPNVILVEENTSSYDMIKDAKLVATVTGTMAYEAALMNIPSITFVPTFFNKLNLCRRINLEDLNRTNLGVITAELNKTTSNVSCFSKFIYKNSFEGNVLDPVTDPSVLQKENIDKIVLAFTKAILFSEDFMKNPCYNAVA